MKEDRPDQDFMFLLDVDGKSIVSKNDLADHFSQRSGSRIRFLSFGHRGNTLLAVSELEHAQFEITIFGVTATKNLVKGVASMIRLTSKRLLDVAVCSTGDIFATADNTGTVTIRELSEGRVLRQFQWPDCHMLLFSPDGSALVCGSTKGRVAILDTRALIRSGR